MILDITTFHSKTKMAEMKAVTSSLRFTFNMLHLTTHEIIKSLKKNSRYTENI